MERRELFAKAEELNLEVNKFWSTKKLEGVVTARVARQERRSDATRRAWMKRRELFGDSGRKPKEEVSNVVTH